MVHQDSADIREMLLYCKFHNQAHMKSVCIDIYGTFCGIHCGHIPCCFACMASECWPFKKFYTSLHPFFLFIKYVLLILHCFQLPIYSFQSCDWRGKKSIKLQHRPVNFPQLFNTSQKKKNKHM